MRYNKKAEIVMAIGVLLASLGILIFVLKEFTNLSRGMDIKHKIDIILIIIGIIGLIIGFIFGGANKKEKLLENE